ncbi:MAG: diguanylate cyclase [Alphaproteobacteria bacterium]|nr:diguanylate cyclase [Alphaproteobacteria bacterium]
MQPDQPSILLNKVTRLRRVYLQKIPQIISEMRNLCLGLEADSTDDEALVELHRLFHGIRGTAASFGMTDISQAGDAGCVLLAPLLHSAHAQQGAALTDVWAGVNDGIDRIEVLSKKTVASPPEDRDGADVAPAPEPKAAPSATKLVPQNRLIYICDEDIKYANELSVQLSSFGYDTECFADPLRLQKAALASPPDVVVMDTMFPASGLSGTDIAARIRLGLAVPPPVVFFSVKNDFQTRLKAVQAGGAAFSLKPIVATTLIDTLDALTRSSETERLRILIMDDEPEAAAYHRMILEQAGMVVRELHHPEHVLEILSEFRPDLILLDLYMRDCSGRDLAGLVRQIPEFISLPIVFLSGETDRVTQVSAQRVGVEGFLTKPIRPNELINAVALRAERMRILRSLMIRDPLTGLFNHGFVTQFLETTLAAARRDKSRFCVVMFDMDHFKSVNDTYGHPVGDQVLIGLARLLSQRLRNSDLVGRYGGEEFVAILRDVGVEDAMRVVDSIRQDFMEIRFHGGEREFGCTFSAGLALYPDLSTAEALMEAADQALYESKHAGRNQVTAASSRGNCD